MRDVANSMKGTIMSLKLRAFALGFLAAIAASAITVMNASAESQATGHFTSEVSHTTLQATQSPASSHSLELTIPGLTGMTCSEVTIQATVASATVTEITGTPELAKCYTTGGTPGELVVHQATFAVLTTARSFASSTL